MLHNRDTNSDATAIAMSIRAEQMRAIIAIHGEIDDVDDFDVGVGTAHAASDDGARPGVGPVKIDVTQPE